MFERRLRLSRRKAYGQNPPYNIFCKLKIACDINTVLIAVVHRRKAIRAHFLARDVRAVDNDSDVWFLI